MNTRTCREARRGPAGRGRLLTVPFLLATVLTLAACQEEPPASSGVPDAPAPPNPAREPEDVASPGGPAPHAVSPGTAPLDLSLPPDPGQEAAALPGDIEPAVLPDLFGPGKAQSSRLSGKVLFQEGEQEGALDHISGAELEVSIPVD